MQRRWLFQAHRTYRSTESPFKRSWQVDRCVVDMQNTAMAGRRRSLRAMDCKHLHHQYVAGTPTCDKDLAALDRITQIPFRQPAMSMRADDDLQRTIILAAVINEHTQRQHV